MTNGNGHYESSSPEAIKIKASTKQIAGGTDANTKTFTDGIIDKSNHIVSLSRQSV